MVWAIKTVAPESVRICCSSGPIFSVIKKYTHRYNSPNEKWKIMVAMKIDGIHAVDSIQNALVLPCDATASGDLLMCALVRYFFGSV